jgi:hypothetical protein
MNTRQLVIEHRIIGHENGKNYPVLILDASWDQDYFHNFVGRTVRDQNGWSVVDGQPVKYDQLFIETDLTDQQILNILK